ncbi:MAG: signal peptidase I [Rhodospirillales bacterium]|jgi:signal peptidase I|nr:signal peptidase I [Rhodospirillales bacterium]
MKHGKASELMDMIRTVIYAVLIALFVRTFGYEPFNIPSGSMKPTLLVGDYLFVSKLSYGYSKHSLPQSLPLIDGRIFFSEPERGDVAVFKLPKDNKTDYIKRIVGLPGDKIQVIEGILNINGEPVGRMKIDDFIEMGHSENNFNRSPQFEETLPNDVKHAILEISDVQMFDNTDVYTVPEGHYFGMGDNRDRSRDSRFLYDVGYIPVENLVGRAEFIFFSINGSVWEFWKWPDTLRLERFFQSIQ